MVAFAMFEIHIELVSRRQLANPLLRLRLVLAL
jgi:hypothetical protein